MRRGIILLAILTLVGCQHDEEQRSKQPVSPEQGTVSQVETKQEGPQHKRVVKDGVTFIDNILIVNKSIGLPQDYSPGEDSEARRMLDELIQFGNSQGLHMVIRSGFRSYDYQAELYNGYVARDGQEEADKYSAQPGHSEHQTGLAFDIGSINASDDFKVTYESTPEGQWLKDHAHEFGFIIRYPKGKEHITGYQYEPWHLRYVGKAIAKDVYTKQVTLEEYLELVK